MKRTIALIAVCMLLLTSCKVQKTTTDTGKPEKPVETAAMKAADREDEPLLYEGEKLYENWVFTYLDADSDGKQDRISFMYVIKDPDNSNAITARLAVETDYPGGGADTAVILERAAESLIKPNAVYASATDDGAVIVLKDAHAPNGEELYVFRYVKDGGLNEIPSDQTAGFPANKVSSMSFSDGGAYAVRTSDKGFDISFGGKTFSFITDRKMPTGEIAVKYNTNDVIMSYEKESCTFIIGMSGSLVARVASDTAAESIPFNAVIVLRYDSGIIKLMNISFSER